MFMLFRLIFLFLISKSLFSVMADLEAKLLSGESPGYCSSSDEEKIECENHSTICDNKKTNLGKKSLHRNTHNTGPKGVLADYKLYKTQTQKDEQQQYELIVQQAKYCTLNEPLNCELEEFRRRRLTEMQESLCAKGKIEEFIKKEQYLDFTESNRDVWVLIHIYSNSNDGCITLNKVFNTLAVNYPTVKLAKVLPSVLDMSSRFEMNALPTLQVFWNDVLIGNFVCLSKLLGEQFTVHQLMNFLDK
ncbi:unnamed protein product [Thelazia callipaeda]|uniref:Phosducin domain-containing protein n=1 Tax=Thelazia callipaeda TaxID=103827 RepID=A0A0N5CJQ8_THECL|nr:unnamed protein product [Thelazia callipaeda]